MSQTATPSAPGVDVGYNPFLPYSGVTSERLRAEQGPRCAKCTKAKWVPAEAGGCDCARYTGETDAGRIFKSIEHRRVEALEALVRIGMAFAASMNVEVPPAPDEAPLPAREPFGPAGLGEAARRVS